MIKTPDQRLRVFISSTIGELAEERRAATEAIRSLRMIPVLFETGARPHPPKELYRAYLDQSHIFIGIYWESYGWIAPDMDISGLDDEYRLSGDKPKLIYMKKPAPERQERLDELLDRIRNEDNVSYKSFSTPDELRELIKDDLALLLTERFEETSPSAPFEEPARAVTRRAALPMAATPFIGREEELTSLEALLLRDDVRLITLTGPGGIGKTRLALEVAGRVAHRFADGVTLVTLAPVADSGLVPAEIALAVGLSETTQRPSIEALRSFFLDRNMLLVLDNFEQVVSAAPVIPEILTAAPAVKVLITSRSLLQVRGEHEFPVPTMRLPEAHPTRLGELADTEAVKLFVERAQAANSNFELDADNAGPVTEIVALLDGLPLAIELAAARSKLLPPRAMVKRLSSRLEVLTGGPRDMPARQRTMRNALDWDYDLLNEEEQSLFRRLSVFAGGFTIESALEITSPEGSDLDVLESIDSLAIKSLVHRVDAGRDEVRFEMLKTIREYAGEKLAEEGEAEEIATFYARYFLDLAEAGLSFPSGPRQLEWIERLEREHDNLRSVLRWAADVGGPDVFFRFCVALTPLWEMRSYLTEGQYWLGLALDRGEEMPADIRARALHGAGVLARGQGQIDRARELLTEAVELRRKAGDEAALALSLKALGSVYIDVKEIDRARELYLESLDIMRSIGDKPGIAQALNNLGVLARFLGHFEEALDRYDESARCFGDVGDRPGLARIYMNMSEAKLEMGDFASAKDDCKRSIEMWREMGSRWDMADCVEILATVLQRQGRPADAARLFGAGEAIRELLSTPLPPSEKEIYDQRVVDTRSELDGTTFAVEWARGRAMSYEEIVEDALQV